MINYILKKWNIISTKLLFIVDYIRYNIPYGIKNLWSWFPIIWRNKDCDSWFFYILIRKKFQLMEKFFRTQGHYVDSKKDANNIKVCIFLLNRIINGETYRRIYKNYEKKWGDKAWNFFADTNLELDKDIIKCIDHEEYLKKQDHEYLFKILNKYIRDWVD